MLAGMKNTSLTRSIPYWILVVVALVTTVLGGWLVCRRRRRPARTRPRRGEGADPGIRPCGRGADRLDDAGRRARRVDP
jgi:hypothetical protein